MPRTDSINTSLKTRTDPSQMQAKADVTARHLVAYVKALQSVRHRSDEIARGRVVHSLAALRAAGHPKVGWLEQVADYAFGQPTADSAPRWHKNPATLPDDATVAIQPLVPSEIEWIKTIAAKAPENVTESDVSALAEMVVKTRTLSDQKYARSVFEPIADHWLNEAAARNQTTADQYQPTEGLNRYRKDLTDMLADVLTESPSIDSEIPEQHTTDPGHRYGAAWRIANERIDSALAVRPQPVTAPKLTTGLERFDTDDQLKQGRAMRSEGSH